MTKKSNNIPSMQLNSKPTVTSESLFFFEIHLLNVYHGVSSFGTGVIISNVNISKNDT